MGPDGLDHRPRPAAGGQERPAVAQPGLVPAPTTSAGPWSGSSRPCCAPVRSPATPTWPRLPRRSSTRCAGPRAGSRRAGPRDPHPEGAGGVRAAAPRRGPANAPQARARRPDRRRVDRPAASAAARRPRAGAAGVEHFDAIDAAAAAGLLETADAAQLRSGWRTAAAVRNAAVLWRGRPTDAVPSDVRDADGVGRIVGPGARHRGPRSSRHTCVRPAAPVRSWIGCSTTTPNR